MDMSYKSQGFFVVVLHSHVGPYWECARHGYGILGEISNESLLLGPTLDTQRLSIYLCLQELQHGSLMDCWLQTVLMLELELGPLDANASPVVTERNSYGLGYHNRQLDSRNQSFPICNRN